MNSTIYIRKENEDKWNKVADKSAWINSLLANSGDTSSYGAVKDTPAGQMITVLSQEIPLKPERKANGQCKVHDTPLDDRGRCLQKDCKYG